MSKTIHQEVTLHATPQQVYAALTDSEIFAAISGAPAKIGHEAGSAFSCFAGRIAGRQIELVPNQRIVQAWRAGAWPEGSYSLVKLELHGSGGQTRLVLDHSAFPPEMLPHLEGGWHKMYWDPLKKHFA